MINKECIINKYEECLNKGETAKNFIQNYIKNNEIKNEAKNNECSLGEYLYRVVFNLKEIPLCYCGKKVSFKRFKFGQNGYYKYCSVKCMANSKEEKEKKKTTSLERYGEDTPLKAEIVKEKIKQTNLEKYGVEYISQNKEIREKIDKTVFEKNEPTREIRNKIKKEKRKIYFRNKIKDDPSFKLKRNISRVINNYIRKERKSYYCFLGIEIQEYKKYIESLFYGNMEWGNYGSLWEIDHVIPISFFNLSKKDHVLKAFNFKNTRPCLRIENNKKSNKIDIKLIEDFGLINIYNEVLYEI